MKGVIAMEEIRRQQLEQFIDSIRPKQTIDERIEESLQQIAEGKTYTHKEVMKILGEKYGRKK